QAVHPLNMSASVAPTHELAVFERWVAGLSETRRAMLSEHISLARDRRPWHRAWLVSMDTRLAATGATHIPPADLVGEWDPNEPEVLLSAEESAACLRWLETGEGPSPWPDESRD